MSELDDLLKFLPAGLVVAGWYIVNRQNDKREARKEARAIINAAKTEVVAVAKLAVEYKLKADRGVAHEIKARLEALEIELENLAYFGNKSPLLKRYVAFTDATTGGDFDAAQPAVRELHSPEVLKILATRNDMLSELEAEFRVHHLGRGRTPG